jgi:hypothetical protein
MSKLEQYAIIGAALFGIATLLLGVVMLFIFPSTAKMTEGFRTPIIAFEFAKTDADLAFLSGSDEIARENRQKMDNGHRWDAVFPFAYAGFIALLLLHLAARGHRWLWVAMPIALLIIPLDLRENGVLVAITHALDGSGSVSALLRELHAATWLKWGALGISLGALAFGFLADKAYLAAVVSVVAALGIAACWASGSAPRVAETMSMLTALFFLYVPVRAIILAWQYTRSGSELHRSQV